MDLHATTKIKERHADPSKSLSERVQVYFYFVLILAAVIFSLSALSLIWKIAAFTVIISAAIAPRVWVLRQKQSLEKLRKQQIAVHRLKKQYLWKTEDNRDAGSRAHMSLSLPSLPAAPQHLFAHGTKAHDIPLKTAYR